jgi:hypothetical protein
MMVRKGHKFLQHMLGKNAGAAPEIVYLRRSTRPTRLPALSP